MTKTYTYQQMGVAFESDDPLSPLPENFASWVHGTVAYDEDDDKFVVFYNVNPGHDISRCSVMMTRKDPEGGFSPPVIIASKKAVESMKTQAAGIAANGDYLVLAGVFPWGDAVSKRTDIYRSCDKGVSWSVDTMRDSADGEEITAFNGDASGFLVLSSGRIITLAVEPAPSYLTRIFYSDDNGTTWKKSSIAGNPTDVTEPAWAQLPDGTIICMARAAVRHGDTSQQIPAKFFQSFDAGETWTEPQDSTSITDFTLSNGEMIVRDDVDEIEFIHHSRFVQPDGYSSLYVSRATFADAKADKFSPQLKIGKLAGNVDYDDGRGDSGYVGARLSKSGLINVFYYNGRRTAANIHYAVGRKR